MFFEKYQKYRNVQLIVNSIRKNNSFNIAEINPDGKGTLSMFLPDDNITGTDLNAKDIQCDIAVMVNDTESLTPEELEYALKRAESISRIMFIAVGVFGGLDASLPNMMLNIYTGSPLPAENIKNTSLGDITHNLDSFCEIMSMGSREIRDIIHHMYIMAEGNEYLKSYARIVNEHYNSFTFANDYVTDGYMKIITGKKENTASYKNFSAEPDIGFYTSHYRIFSDMYSKYKAENIQNNILLKIGDAESAVMKQLYDMKASLSNPEKYTEISIVYEKNTVSRRYGLKTDGFSIDIDVKGAKKALIKPVNGICAIELKKFKINRNGVYTDIFPLSNASKVNGGCYIFETDKPEFSVDIDGAESISFGFSYLSGNMSGMEHMSKLYENITFLSDKNENLNKKIKNMKYSENEKLSEKDEEIGLLKNKINDLKSDIRELEYTLSQRDKELDEIKNSKSWKMTAPFRKQ